jgi:NADPH:quinone reductase-like Zn-dependent oxidoreductase
VNYEADTPLPKTMQAVVCHGPEDYRLQEWDVPQPGPEEVVIKVKSVGICASDLKCYLGAPMFWGDAHRTGYCQSPVIPGHEFVGQVVALGPGRPAKNMGWLWAIWPSLNRLFPAGSVASAKAANTGCVRTNTMFTALGSAPLAQWPNICFFPAMP